jgi:GDPmannose 4,6-dehydratase
VQDEPQDYVVATGESHSVREFVEKAFVHVNMPIEWEGSGVEEVGKCKKTGAVRVKVNPKYYRPAEVDQLLGDPSKAKKQLGWAPKITFDELVKIMVDADVELMKRDPTA